MQTAPSAVSPIALLRFVAGESQADLAARAGISRDTVSRLERGEHPRLITARALSRALGVDVAAELIDAIADAVRVRLEQELAPAAQEYLTTAEAAEYLRCGKQRVFDLTSRGRLRVAKDGSRNLYRREWLDAYLDGRAA